MKKVWSRLVVDAGVVVQSPDGSREAITPEEAEKRLTRMSRDEKRLYEPLE